MTIPQEHLGALRDLGYTEQEARFVYLVATHSGYFTLQQYLDFTGTTKGRSVHEFTEKSTELGHLRSVACAYGTALYNLYSRRVYGALDRENLRNRRHLSTELIRTRLSILDFVIAHPDLRYLETEAEKVACFKEKFRIPDILIPGRVYQGIERNSTTKRCFVDRFPIYLYPSSKNSSANPTPVFVYCDSAPRSLLHFITHLKNYEQFLRRLPNFGFVYASPTTTKSDRAERFFRGTFEDSSAANIASVTRYFRLRRLWEEEKHELLTRVDRDLLRRGNQRYRDQFWESTYRKWATGNLENGSLEVLLRGRMPARNWLFQTNLLPHKHNIFSTSLSQEIGRNLPEPRSASRSGSCSVAAARKYF